MAQRQASIDAAFIEPVRLTARVRRSIDDAFAIFTARMDEWWPLETHTFGPGRSRHIVLEPRVGGRFFERFADGEEHTAGHVLVWQPPELVVFTWQHDDWVAATEVHVRFVAEDSNVTRIEVEHRAWERLGRAGAESREEYANGWPAVLRHYAATAGPA